MNRISLSLRQSRLSLKFQFQLRCWRFTVSGVAVVLVDQKCIHINGRLILRDSSPFAHTATAVANAHCSSATYHRASDAVAPCQCFICHVRVPQHLDHALQRALAIKLERE